MSSKNYQNNQKDKGICRCIERQKNFSSHFLRITVLSLLLILFSITSAFAVSYEVEDNSCPNVPWSDYIKTEKYSCIIFGIHLNADS